MAIVHGLLIDVSGKQLATLARKTADACDARAADMVARLKRHNKAASKHKQHHDHPPASPMTDVAGSRPFMFGSMEQVTAITGRTNREEREHECGWTHLVNTFSEQLRAHAESLRFMADHWPAKNTYRLDANEYAAVANVPFDHVQIPED